MKDAYELDIIKKQREEINVLARTITKLKNNLEDSRSEVATLNRTINSLTRQIKKRYDVAVKINGLTMRLLNGE